MARTVSSLCFLPWPRRQSGIAANNSRNERNSWRVYDTLVARQDHSGRSAGSAKRARASGRSGRTNISLGTSCGSV